MKMIPALFHLPTITTTTQNHQQMVEEIRYPLLFLFLLHANYSSFINITILIIIAVHYIILRGMPYALVFPDNPYFISYQS